MSENKSNDIWTTNKRSELKAAINNDNRVDGDFYKVKVRSDDEFVKLPVYKIKHDILGYNFDNGRIIAEKTHYEQDKATTLDPTNDEHQKVIGKILYSSKFYSNTATEELRKDIKKKGLEEPLIVSIDGTVWNGNRRLSIYRKMYEDKGEPKYEWVNLVVLPELSSKDLKRLERRLQMYKEWKQPYGIIQTHLDIRSSMNDKNWEIPEIIASYGYRYKKEDLVKHVQEIDLIDDYLERIKRPKDYVFIKTTKSKEGGGTGVESFVTLNQTLQRLRKGKKKTIEIEKAKLSGFQIIHHPDSTHDNVRDYAAVMSNSTAKDEFEKNSITFKNFNEITKSGGANAFGNEYVTNEYDNLDLAYQTVSNSKKDARKIATGALKMLEKISADRIPKNNDKFKKILDDLEKQISRIRSKSG